VENPVTSDIDEFARGRGRLGLLSGKRVAEEEGDRQQPAGHIAVFS